ncbi:hypothetical protein, partial [Flammeovirga pacifica]|uniref:hypothetical protein n=1 Tax=Flammeovirga pacifica TaxID=915059 RepID=UPI001A8D8480
LMNCSKFELVNIQSTDKVRFNEILNAKLDAGFDFETLREKEIHKLTDKELYFLIEEYIENEKNSMYNKGRRSIKKYRIELEEEYEKRTE